MIALFLLLFSPDNYEPVPEPEPTGYIELYEFKTNEEGMRALKIEFDENGTWASESFLDATRKTNVRKLTGKLNEEDFKTFSEELRELMGKIGSSYNPEPKNEKYVLWVVAFKKTAQSLSFTEIGADEDVKAMRDKIKKYTLVAYEDEVMSQWEAAWNQAKLNKPVIYRLKEVTIGSKGNFDIVLVDEGKEYFIATAINDNSIKTLNLAKVLKSMGKPPTNKAHIEVRQKFHLDAGEVLLPP